MRTALSALQLALHLHTLLADGVFVPAAGSNPEARPRFVPLSPPTEEEVESLLKTIIKRVRRLLERRGRLEADADPGDQLCSTYAAASRSPANKSIVTQDERPPLCARIDGFSLHAGTAIHENDRAGLERSFDFAQDRYGARPALSVDRLRA